ncbi:MAG: hypothetical protein ACK41O_26685 [Runella zeae]
MDPYGQTELSGAMLAEAQAVLANANVCQEEVSAADKVAHGLILDHALESGGKK